MQASRIAAAAAAGAAATLKHRFWPPGPSKGLLTVLVTSRAGPSPRTFRALRDSKTGVEARGETEGEAERGSEIAHIERFFHL